MNVMDISKLVFYVFEDNSGTPFSQNFPQNSHFVALNWAM